MSGVSPIRSGVTAFVLAGLWTACAAAQDRRPPPSGTPQCRSGKVDNYLADHWQRCWFDAARGRWRTLSHEFHYDVLVVETESASLDNAEEILRRFVDLHRGRFTDITIYVRLEPASKPGPVRRIHWEWDTKTFDTLDFTGAKGHEVR